MKKDGKVYIYNKYQAIYYMQNGLIPMDTGTHYKSRKTFWVFDYYDHRKIFGKWIEESRNRED
ncbi:hypothetical protein [uncultured Clostridium sp.]|jgi:hypothetical protein|uniref:hypothetical protein n=1 Tax=uncultured Clostridium sp. TaxID=59620 RepID=UPI0026DACC18|nr:hypothetical protein [uncultured Clostridium sp.]